MTTKSPRFIIPILLLALVSIGIDVLRKLIFAQFDLFRILSADYLMFGIGLESVLLILASILTYLAIRNFPQGTLWISLLKALIFDVFYALVGFLSSRIMSLMAGVNPDAIFDLYNSFLNSIPYGITQGILFMFIMSHYKERG
jgi:hypothetical protein